MKITIGHLFPDALNLYGNRGNIQCLVKRLQWRGVETELKEYRLGDNVDFASLDIVVMGGGAPQGQLAVGQALRNKKKELRSYVEDHGVLLAIDSSYQLLGRYYDTKKERIEGLSVVDIHTTYEETRLVSNTILENDAFSDLIVGFENHGGRTEIGNYKPFGRVCHGHGNNGNSGAEGIWYHNLIGTYLHGPLLPKNPQVCDLLLGKAMERKYGCAELEELDDWQEREANQHMVKRMQRGK